MNLKLAYRRFAWSVPSASLMDTELQKNKYTPDLPQLLESEHQLVFAYGEDQTGMHGHVMLQDHITKVARAFTYHKFAVWKKKLGVHTYPVAVNYSFDRDEEQQWWHGSAPLAKVKGELFKIRSAHIPVLDSYRENGVQFERKRVLLIVPFRKGPSLGSLYDGYLHVRILRAWMYVGLRPYWEPLIDINFDYAPVSRYINHGNRFGQYYHFGRLEYHNK